MHASLLCCLLCIGETPRCFDGLDEVNALRQQYGLPAYIYDEGLARAAGGCAIWRARRLCSGHTVNDFAALPPGVTAQAAGCAAWHPSWGWGSCCKFDRYRYAGAAWVWGRDGRRYMHIFCR